MITGHPIFSMYKVSPVSLLSSYFPGRFILSGLNLLHVSILQKEVLKSIDSTKSTQQFHVIGSNKVIGESNDNNQMSTTTLTMRRTGDQIIEEAEYIDRCILQAKNFSSAITKTLFISLGGL